MSSVAKRRNRDIPERHPGGRRKRRSQYEARQEDVRLPGYAARQRRYGVSDAVSRLAECESAVGRLCARQLITPEHYAAAKGYEKVYRNAQRAYLSSSPQSASNYDRRGGYDDSDGTDEHYAAWCARVLRRYKTARNTLLNAGTMCMFAVDTWVIAGQEDMHLLPDLVLALDALADRGFCTDV